MRGLYAEGFASGDAQITISLVKRRPSLETALFYVFIAASLGNLPVQTANAQRLKMWTFTSSDGAFRFNYPDSLVLCHPDPHQQEMWEPHQWCNSYIPLCSSRGRNVAGVVVCLGFRAGPPQQGTTFEGAVFSAVDLGVVQDETSCLKIPKPQAPPGRWKPKTINGIMYNFMISDGVASGQGGDDYVYRTVHRGRCYELNTMIASFNGSNTDPPTKGFDLAPVKRALNLPLHTFEFPK